MNVVDSSGDSALHKAAYSGQTAIVELLMAEGADRNATDSDGATPLDLASSEGQTAVVDELLLNEVVAEDVDEVGG